MSSVKSVKFDNGHANCREISHEDYLGDGIEFTNTIINTAHQVNVCNEALYNLTFYLLTYLIYVYT